MPAAAVIPAPIAYIKIVAVKKLVVEYQVECCMGPYGLMRRICLVSRSVSLLLLIE